MINPARSRSLSTRRLTSRLTFRLFSLPFGRGTVALPAFQEARSSSIQTAVVGDRVALAASVIQRSDTFTNGSTVFLRLIGAVSASSCRRRLCQGASSITRSSRCRWRLRLSILDHKPQHVPPNLSTARIAIAVRVEDDGDVCSQLVGAVDG